MVIAYSQQPTLLLTLYNLTSTTHSKCDAHTNQSNLPLTVHSLSSQSSKRNGENISIHERGRISVARDASTKRKRGRDPKKNGGQSLAESNPTEASLLRSGRLIPTEIHAFHTTPATPAARWVTGARPGRAKQREDRHGASWFRPFLPLGPLFLTGRAAPRARGLRRPRDRDPAAWLLADASLLPPLAQPPTPTPPVPIRCLGAP